MNIHYFIKYNYKNVINMDKEMCTHQLCKLSCIWLLDQHMFNMANTSKMGLKCKPLLMCEKMDTINKEDTNLSVPCRTLSIPVSTLKTVMTNLSIILQVSV